MKFKYSVIFLLFFSASIFAQNYLTNLTYSMAVPTGNTTNFIDQFSWRGFQLEGKRFINKNTAVGITFGWNILNVETRDLIQLENGAISGRQFRYINAWPILIHYQYYMGRKRDIRPYIGVGVGTYYIYQKYEIGILLREKGRWHLGVAPDVGVIIPAGNSTYIVANVKYNYAFDSGNTILGDPDNSQAYVSFNIGLGFSGY